MASPEDSLLAAATSGDLLALQAALAAGGDKDTIGEVRSSWLALLLNLA